MCIIHNFDSSLISWINFSLMREVNILFSSIKNPNPKITKMEVLIETNFLFFPSHYLNFFLAESYRPGLSPYVTRPGVTNQKHTKPKVIIADLQEQSLRGICLCFLRNSKKTVITGQNIVNVCLQIFSFLTRDSLIILLRAQDQSVPENC